MTNKKKWLIAVGVLLACVLAVVLSMPRFYTGDRIKVKVKVTGADSGVLGFDVKKPNGQSDDFDEEVNGYTAELSAKADEYGRYSVIMNGADYTVEMRIMKYDWFQRTNADLAIDFGDDECYYSATVSSTKGELPLRENYNTSGSAEKEDGKFVIYL